MFRFICAVSLVVAGGAQAATRQCLFERIVTPVGMQSITLPVALTQKGGGFRIAVPNGSVYDGKMRQNGSSTEYRFRTPVSSEILAVSAQGEGLWQVDFNNGDTISYVGVCGKVKD